MIWAHGDYVYNSGYAGVSYHSGNKSYPDIWYMTVSSDGSVESSGNNGLTSPVNTNLILTLTNGSTLSAGYSSETVTYFAHVKMSTWMGIGYGNSMENTDEVIWAAGVDYVSSTVYDTYSTT